MDYELSLIVPICGTLGDLHVEIQQQQKIPIIKF